MRRRIALGAGLLACLAAGLATGLAGGCFKPDNPACAFSCATPPHDCPTGWTCGADLVCHNPNSAGQCLITTDAAAPDGPASDGGGGDVGARDSAPEAGGDAGPGG
jgi:hypothetical protein